MASSVIGSLRVMLGMDTAEFEKGATRTQREMRAMERRFQQVGRNMSKIGAGLTAAITTPILGAAAAFGRSAHDMAAHSQEMANAAQVAGEGFEQFQRQAHAASRVGIEFEQLSDIFKDTRERIGEFLVTGGGPLQDAFDALGGKVKLTVEELRGLSGKDALQLIVDRMQEAGLSIEQMSFVLESMGSDATKLIPLLRDGGKAFEEYGAGAAVITQADAAKFKAYTDAQREMGEAMKELTIALVGSGVLDVVVDLVKGFSEFVSGLSETNPEVVKFGVVIAGVASAIGPALMALGGLVQLFAPLIGSAGFGGLAAAAGPVGIAIAAVAAAGVLIYQNWEKIGPVLAEVRDKFVEAIGPKLERMVETVKTTLTELWEGPLGEMLRKVAEVGLPLLGEAFVKMNDVASRILGALIEIVTTTFDQVGNILNFVGQLLTGDFAGAWESVKEMVDTAVKGLLRVVVALFPEIEGHVQALYLGVKNWLQEKLTAVFDFVGGKIRELTGMFESMYIAVVGNSYVPDMVDGIATQFARLTSVMVEPARAAAAAVEREFARLANGTRGIALPTIEGEESSTGVAEGQAQGRGTLGDVIGLSNEWQAAIQNIGSTFGGVARGIAEAISTVVVPALQQGAAQANQMQQAFQNITNLLQKVFGKTIGGILGVGLQIASAFAGGGSNVGVPGFANGGSMRLGGFAGVDSNLLSLNGSPLARVSRGETMSIRPANDRGMREVTVRIVDTTGLFVTEVEGAAARVVGASAEGIARAGAGMAMKQLRDTNERRLG